MKKYTILLLFLMSMLCIYSLAFAYDSAWDHYTGGNRISEPEIIVETESAVSESNAIADMLAQNFGTAEPESENLSLVDVVTHNFETEITQESNTTDIISDHESLKSGSIRLDSVEIYGDSDESTSAILQILSGLKIAWNTQNSSTPRSGFEVSLNENPLLNYSLQSGQPYYFSSNILGNSAYMVYDEDEFEEKLVTALYNLIESYSEESTDQLPPLDDLLSIIKAYRAKELQVSMPTSASISFEAEIDPSAYMGSLLNIMSRFVDAEPIDSSTYFFTDYDPDIQKYSWPDVNNLPAFPQAVSATTAMFFEEDILELIDALPQFFNDNPELADTINQLISQSMARMNQNSTSDSEQDHLSQYIDTLRENAQENLKDFYLNLRIDQDEYGTPTLIAVEIGKQEQNSNSGLIFMFHSTGDEEKSVFELAANAFDGNESAPIMRTIVVTDQGEDGNLSVNFRLGDDTPGGVEYAQLTERYTASTLTKVSNSNIQFDLEGESGNLVIFHTAIPNNFDGYNSTTSYTYKHSSYGQPVFMIGLTAENSENEVLPELTPADAIAASDLTDSDYNALAQSIFMQFVILSMIFM